MKLLSPSMKKLSINILILMAIFNSCSSPKKLFRHEARDLKATIHSAVHEISENTIADLPEPVQGYFRQCGFVGACFTDYAEIIWEKSSIKLQPDRKWMKLKTMQFNFVSEPSRLAYMKASMLGVIPFEGRDKYALGGAHMYGVLGKLIKIFDAKDRQTAQGAAIVLLAEALFIPQIAIQNYIHWESVDDMKANARFIHKGIDVGGTFHFNENGEYVRFTTNERPYSKPDGNYEFFPYTIEIKSYQQQGNIKIAQDVSAIWHLPDGDYEYWKGRVKEINFMK
jgi:hypothetical protein